MDINTSPDVQFEQSTVSPVVLQFTVDYLFVKHRLTAEGIATTVDTGMGDADLALSIVNDAYNHDRATKYTEMQKENTALIPWEIAKKDLGIDG